MRTLLGGIALAALACLAPWRSLGERAAVGGRSPASGPGESPALQRARLRGTVPVGGVRVPSGSLDATRPAGAGQAATRVSGMIADGAFALHLPGPGLLDVQTYGKQHRVLLDVPPVAEWVHDLELRPGRHRRSASRDRASAVPAPPVAGLDVEVGAEGSRGPLEPRVE